MGVFFPRHLFSPAVFGRFFLSGCWFDVQRSRLVVLADPVWPSTRLLSTQAENRRLFFLGARLLSLTSKKPSVKPFSYIVLERGKQYTSCREHKQRFHTPDR